MPSDSQLICRRCGFTNVAGDGFCGSCGAFLEWEGEAADGGVPPSAGAGDPDVPVVGSPGAIGGAGQGAPGTPSAAPTVTWSPPPAQATVVSPPPVDAGLLRCPSCGIANPSTRTFCQSCGTKLADAGRVGPASAAQIAAAVAAPVRPVAPTAAVAAGSRAAEGSGGGRRLVGWLLVLAALGIVVGIGVVVGSSLLKPPPPPSEAGSAPPSGGTASSAAPATAGPSTAPTEAATGTNAPVTPAPAAVELTLTGASASSFYGDLQKYQPGNVMDGDPKTSWQEGAKVEKGQWIEVSYAPGQVKRIVVYNGFGASKDLYNGNLRLKDVLISIDGGAPLKVQLKDTMKPQSIKIDGPVGTKTIRITIVSTYKSVKTAVPKTPFDDAALSEIQVFGIPGT